MSDIALSLIETQCEAAIVRQYGGQFVGWEEVDLPERLIHVLNCPNLCSNHGLCNGRECLCDAGYTGIDCSVLESKTTPISYIINIFPAYNVKLFFYQRDFT